ncbi:MAG: hypothetical protein H9W81_13975 [Enterococcus sp.]|nr:hypothetical protein [Enterococcus sp.]
MITQKGLLPTDVFSIICEGGKDITIHIAIPECEKFTVSKSYASITERDEHIQADIESFIASHTGTTFTVYAAPDEQEEVVNDSWSAIFNDAKANVKTRFKS